MFETFNIPAAYITMQPPLSLYSAGHTTGLVLELGDGVSQIVPVYEGKIQKNATQIVRLGGADITSYLSNILMERGYRFTGAAQRDIVRDMKEKFAYVALDYKKEINTANSEEQNYELPDGQVITIGHERFWCTEILFQPAINGLDGDGIQDAIYNSIMMVKNENMKREILKNGIVLGGGSSMFPGILNRLSMEIAEKFPESVNVVASQDRKYSAWIGGSIVATLSSMKLIFISKGEYDEYGSFIVHKKCDDFRQYT